MHFSVHMKLRAINHIPGSGHIILTIKLQLLIVIIKSDRDQLS